MIFCTFSYSQKDYKYTDFAINKIPKNVTQYKFVMPDSVLNQILQYNFDENGRLILEIDKSSFTLPDSVILESRYFYDKGVLVKIITQGKGFNKDMLLNMSYTYDKQMELQKIDSYDGIKHDFRTYKYANSNLNVEENYFIDSLLNDKYSYYKNDKGQIIKKIHNRYYSNYTTTVLDSFVYLSSKERLWFSSWDYNVNVNGKTFSTEYYDDNNNYLYSIVESKYPTSTYKYIYDLEKSWIQRRYISKNGLCFELVIRKIQY